MKNSPVLVGVLFGLTLAGPCVLRATSVPFYDGLGPYKRLITTSSPEAQRYFDQGLAFLHGFNHGMAIASFQEAARLDPSCAMAHWGIALAAGPHINLPVVFPPMAELAWSELERAKQHASGTTPVEQALIHALESRYASPQPDDRSGLDRAYADAMRTVWIRFPNDPDVGAFFAEAMMNLRPWDQWTPDGMEQPGTADVLATLEAVLKLNINHPFANHLYIHAVEASPHPERADAAADRMRELQPGVAHNVHMPSHIDIRNGRWQDAIDSNLKAVEADRKFRGVAGPPNGFILIYIAHNEHMLAYAAMMTGQSNLALRHIRAMVDGLPEDFLKEWALAADGFAAMPYEVMLRFGRWDEVLAEPEHPEYMPFTRAFRHAARGIAYAAKGDIEAARVEQRLYLDACTAIPAEATFGNNTANAITAIATPMLEGEILVRAGRFEEGCAKLRDAIAAEDLLRYDEPPGWNLPVRHSLGASLMAAGRYAEAEAVYRDDLARLPENGWSLFGLAEALIQQGRTKDAAPIVSRFTSIWKHADISIKSSCFCQPGT